MTQADDAPKLHIDSDWKAEAQAEKERLAEQEVEKTKQREDGGGPNELPQASFEALVRMLASQAIMGLGAVQDPKTGGVMLDLDGARFSIDLLAVLEEKTKGNLSAEEATELSQLLPELRARFVQITQLVAEQAAQGNVTTVSGAPDPASAPGATKGPPS